MSYSPRRGARGLQAAARRGGGAAGAHAARGTALICDLRRASGRRSAWPVGGRRKQRHGDWAGEKSEDGGVFLLPEEGRRPGAVWGDDRDSCAVTGCRRMVDLPVLSVLQRLQGDGRPRPRSTPTSTSTPRLIGNPSAAAATTAPRRRSSGGRRCWTRRSSVGSAGRRCSRTQVRLQLRRDAVELPRRDRRPKNGS